jgi:hypothetical protein
MSDNLNNSGCVTDVAVAENNYNKHLLEESH